MKKLLIILFLFATTAGYSQVRWTDTTAAIGMPDHNVSQVYPLPVQLYGSNAITANATDSVLSFCDTLLYGDSITTLSTYFTPNGRFSYIELTVQDTGTVGDANQSIDSIKVYSKKSSGNVTMWGQIGLRGLLTVTDKTVTDAGNGVRTYLIYDPVIRDLIFQRSNVANIVGRRTIIIITLKK